MKKVRKLVCVILVMVSLTISASAVDLFIDTEKIDTDTSPTIVNNRTMVPLRAIFESLGATVEWDAATRTATGTRDDITVVIQIDNPTAYVNGEAKELDVPAMIINNRTMVPARFISESLNCEVTWNEDAFTAAVAYELKGQKIYVTKTGKKYHFSETCNGGTYYEATLAEAMGRGLEPCDKCVLTNGHTASQPINLVGEWEQRNKNSETSYQFARITGDTIEVYWQLDSVSAVYWIGTYAPPTSGDLSFSWESARNKAKTDLALLASSDETKTFTYANGVISYEVTAMGMTKTVELVKVA